MRERENLRTARLLALAAQAFTKGDRKTGVRLGVAVAVRNAAETDSRFFDALVYAGADLAQVTAEIDALNTWEQRPDTREPFLYTSPLGAAVDEIVAASR